MVHRNLRKGQKIELLRQVDLFRSCTTRELGQIAALTTELEVTANSVLMRRGDLGKEFFVIVEGTATVTRESVELAKLSAGSFFGELALIDGGPRTATVVARTDMKVLVLSRHEFWSLLNSVPPVASKVVSELGSRLRMRDEMLDSWPEMAERLKTWSL